MNSSLAKLPLHDTSLPLETPGVTRQVFVAGGVEILIEVFADGRVRVNGDEVEVVGKAETKKT